MLTAVYPLHAWLSQRNRNRLRTTQEGLAELEGFDGQPLLMDGRRKNKRGEDGAMQVNAGFLREHSVRVCEPIAALRAFHDGPGSIEKLDKWDAEDFRGMPATLELCRLPGALNAELMG